MIIAELSRARSEAPWVGKFGHLCIREILVVTCSHVTVRPTDRPFVRTTGIPMKITQSTGMLTQMQLEIFCRKTAWPNASYEAETIKESAKITWKAEIVSISVLSKVVSLN